MPEEQLRHSPGAPAYPALTSEIAVELAKVRSLLRRDTPLRAVETLQAALERFCPASAPAGAKIVMENCIRECVDDLNRNRSVRNLLGKLDMDGCADIPYLPGREDRLNAMLKVLRKGLCGAPVTGGAPKPPEQKRQDCRKVDLWSRGVFYLNRGPAAKGKAALRRMALEFGREPGVLANIGNLLLNAGQPEEAAGHLKLAASRFPEDAGAQAGLLLAYARHGLEKMAESVHERILTGFHDNPHVLLELAPVYLDWGNRAKALELARSIEPALPDHPDLAQLKNFTAETDN